MNAPRLYRIDWKQFLNETTPDDRDLIRQKLNETLLYFINRDQSIFLEQFGILFPVSSRKQKSDVTNGRAYLIKEKIRSVGFEKCLDLVEYYRNRFPNIIETSHIAKRLYAQLPIAKQEIWEEKKVASYLRTLIQAIRDEIIIDGSSAQLSALGRFYSLHNRQGANIRDWFAGADIFIIPQYTDRLQAEQPQTFPRPVLENAYEPFEALHGKPLHCFTIELKNELAKLGYDVSSLDQNVPQEQKNIHVNIYGNEINKSLLVCSDGFRFFAEGSRASVDINEDTTSHSNEIVFQISRTAIGEDPQSQMHTQTHIHKLIARVFTLAWVLLQGRPSRTLKPGLALSSEAPLLQELKTKLKGIYITPFSPIKLPQLYTSRDGGSREFYYMNIIGITSDEMKVAELYSPTHLLELLRFRKYDQITNLRRASVTNRTGLLHPSEQPAKIARAKTRVHSPKNIM